MATMDVSGDLRALIHSHALFFDRLVEMIPANIYIPKDNPTDQWVHGMSKEARAASKRATRENLKRAKRTRLDPEKPRTTLEIINHQESPKVTMEEQRTVTIDELREKLHKRIELLRSKRHADTAASTAKSAKDWQTEKKRDRKSKVPEEDGVKAPSAKRPKLQAKAAMPDSHDAEGEMEFGRVKMGIGPVATPGRTKKESKEKLLAKAIALQKDIQDPEKGQEVVSKHSWSAAVSRAAGEKVLDNPKLLKKSIKKDEQLKHKSAKKWQERKELEKKQFHAKQDKRKENITQRADVKKERAIAKREKKLARPGFEGRKQGFINKAD